MSTDFQNKIDIQPILDKINSVVRKELNKVLYNNVVKNLTAELRKCKKDLEEARKYYQQTDSEASDNSDNSDDDDECYKNEEHISLNIEDINDEKSEVSMEQIFKEVNVNSSNTQIKSIAFDIDNSKFDDLSEEEGINEAEEEEAEEEEAEEEEDAEEEEEEDISEAEEEEEEAEEEEEEAEEEEEDISEAEEEDASEAEEEVSTQAVNNTVVEEDDIETEESDSEEEEEEVFEIEIDDITYFATSEENGPLYEVDEYGEPGKQVGNLKEGEPIFFSDDTK